MADGRNIDNLNIKVTADITDAKKKLGSLTQVADKMNLPTGKIKGQGKEIEQAVDGINNKPIKPTADTSQIKQVGADADKTKGSLDRLRGISPLENLPEKLTPSAVKMKELGYASDSVRSRLNSLGQKIKGIFIDRGILTYKGEVAQLDSELRKLASEYSDLRAKAEQYEKTNNPQGNDQKYNAMISKLEELKNQYRETLKEKNKLVASGEAKVGLNTEGFRSALSSAHERVSGFSSKLTSLSDKTREFSKRMLSAINPMKRFSNENKNASNSSNLLTRALGKTWMMLKRLVQRMILKGMITSVRQGFQNLAQYSEDVNKKISAIGSSLIQLKNAFAVAFMPIISAITPALTSLIDFISTALNKVGELASAITGKNTWVSTLKPAYDYAKSIADSSNSTAKSTGKTKKNLKEIKNATIGIDNLNVIAPNDNSNANNGSGNGNKGNDVSGMFTTKKVSKEMKKIARLIKKVAKELWKPIETAFNKQKKIIVKSWKYALNEILKLGKDVGKDFLDVWDSAETEKIFENIFKIIANIGKVVGNLAKQFRIAWNKNKVGKKIFEAIRDIIGVIVEGIEEASEYTVEWADNIDFYPLLDATQKLLKSMKKPIKFIVDTLKNFYQDIVLPIIKWIVETAMPKLEKVFTDFNNKIEWDSLAKNLHKIFKAVEKIGEGFGEGLIEFFGNLADISATAINALFGKDGAGTKLTDWIDKQDPEQIKKVGNALGYITGALILFKPVASVLGKITKFVVKIAPYAKWIFVSLGKGFKAFGKGLFNFGKGATEAGTAFVFLPMLPAYLDELDEALGITDKINAFIDGIKPLRKALDTISDVWTNVWGGIFGTASVIIKFFVNLVKVIGNILFSPLHAYNEIAKLFGWKKVDLSWLKVDYDADSYAKDFVDTFEEYTGKRIGSSKKVEKKYSKAIKDIEKNNLADKSKTLKKALSLDEKYYKNRKKIVKAYDDYTKENNKKYVSDFKSTVSKLSPEVRKSVNATGKELAKINNKNDVAEWVNNAKSKLKDLPSETRTKVAKVIKEIEKIPKNRKTDVSVKANGTKQTTKEIDSVANKKRTAKIKTDLQVGAKELSKRMTNAINKAVKGTHKPTITLNAKASLKKIVVGKKTAKQLNISIANAKLRGETYEFDGMKAKGGFPRVGSFYIAGESGSELVGNINGKTGVASNQEITGIKSAIDTQGSNETQLLIEQNKLLRALLEKNTDVVLDGKSITKTVNEINARSGKTLVTA